MADVSSTATWRRRLPVIILAVYWPAMFLMTHLSSVRVQQLQYRGHDVFLHGLAFLALTLLYWLARHGFKPPQLHSGRTYLTLLLLAGYAAVDEITQGLVEGRDSSIIDWLSDLGGCLVGLLLLIVCRRCLYWLIVYWLGFFLLRHWPHRESLFEILPHYFAQFAVAALTVAYMFLTLLWVRTLSPLPRFVMNKRILLLSVLVLPTYAVFDQLLDKLTGRGLDAFILIASLLGILLALLAAAAFARHHLVADAGP